MVECDLPKVEIAGSSPVSRSMVTRGMFWKRFYFVVVLLSCNCFLLSCNWLCENLKKLFCCGSSETNDDFNLNIPDNADNIKPFNDLNILAHFSPHKKKHCVTFKTVLLSATDYKIGKTTIKNHVNKNNCFVYKGNDFTIVTASILFLLTENLTTKKEEVISMEIHDTTSSSLYTEDVNKRLKNASAIIFVYDICNAKSFEALGNRIEEVKNIAIEVETNPLFFLLGNEHDLNETMQVETEAAKKFAEKNDLIFLGECNAKKDIYRPINEKSYYIEKKKIDEGGKCFENVKGIFKDIAWHYYKKKNLVH